MVSEILVITEPLISAGKLLGRWKGLYFNEYIEFIDTASGKYPDKTEIYPTVYILERAFEHKDGTIEARCYPYFYDKSTDKKYKAPYVKRNYGQDYDLEGIVFKIAEIEELENRNPKFLLPLVDIDKIWEKKQQSRYVKQARFTATAQQLIIEKDARIATLEAELASATAEPTSTVHTDKRTQTATEARKAKVLDEWKAAFKIMLAVAMQCQADGPRKRTKTEFDSMCSRHGGKLKDTQLAFLRECLPDDHVNREGGAPIQGCPPS
jgi:hypothetical protein